MIVHCAETVRGGVATYLSEILPLQVRDFGYGNVHLILPSNQISDVLVPEGVLVTGFVAASSRIVSAFRLALCLRKILRSKKFKLVHLHSSYAGTFARVYVGLFSVAKLVYCSHGWAWDAYQNFVLRRTVGLIEKFLSKFCSIIICISNYEFQRALVYGVPENKMRMIPNALGGVDDLGFATCAMEGWPAQGFRVLFVGRLDHQKGIDIFMGAMRQLVGEAVGQVVGDRVRGDASSESVPSNVLCSGWKSRSEIYSIMRSADVLVVPSRWEGFGLVALEGMRAGLPLIVSNAGALTEIVVDGETGIVFENGSVKSLVEAIRRIKILDRGAMGSAGFIRWSEKYSISRLHSDLMNVYADLNKESQ